MTIPRPLTDRYDDLLREQLATSTRLDEIRRELGALEYSLQILDPEWEPPAKPPRTQKPHRLPTGTVSKDCLVMLQQHGELWTRELVNLLIVRRKLKFTDRHDAGRFASAVAIALRRYERRGFLEIVDRDERTNTLKWRICASHSHRPPGAVKGVLPHIGPTDQLAVGVSRHDR